MKNIIVIYHGDCWDGLAGAWAAWKRFGERADYWPMKYGIGSRDPLKLKDKEVYIIDFSFREAVMKKIVAQNKKVVALDHHVSAEASTKLASDHVYDLKHSGAMIAWKYFYPQKTPPQILKNIEDMDIWKFKVPYTKEVFAYLSLFDYELKNLDGLIKRFQKVRSRMKIIATAKDLRKQQKKMIEGLLKNAGRVKFGKYQVLAVNSPLFASELGHILSKKHPPFAVVWHETGRMMKVSLRSNGKFDVAKLAERHGGGGHKAAAGFAVPLSKKLPWKVIK